MFFLPRRYLLYRVVHQRALEAFASSTDQLEQVGAITR
jgi:hypothetical protein